MQKNKYRDTAASIEEYVSQQLTDKYQEAVKDIDGCGADIAHHLGQLANRSREYHNPSFVVLVVGPVKSGKSTFVNLVARNYVSPTHFLECTVRPSLIFSGNEERLTVYRSTDTQHKEEQINCIIDSINGLTDEASVTNVRREQYAHTPKNIDRYVKQGNVSVDNDDILLTSIETHGGKLLQDHVYLVDMAGFDGDKVNFESPAYKAVIERADLIVFVQSSNSAISKVSATFFELLQRRNHSVPVCLVHNVFESAYWRDEESKRRDIEEQKEYAVEQIKSRYSLVLDEGYAFNLNLGKVDDWRKGNFRPETEQALAQEAARFEEAETAMYELFRKRESIRLANCISRTSIQRDNLLVQIKEAVAQMRDTLTRYKEVATSFDALKREQIGHGTQVLVTREELEQIVNEEYCAMKNLVNARGEKATFETKAVRNLVGRMQGDINAHITRLVNDKRKECRHLQYTQEFQDWQVAVLQVTARYLQKPAISAECSTEDMDVDWGTYIDTQELIPKKLLWYKHNTDSVMEYLTYARDKYCGFATGSDTKARGLIDNELLDKANAILRATRQDVEHQLLDRMTGETERLKGLALATIIPDYPHFEHNLALLCDMEQDVESLNIHSDE